MLGLLRAAIRCYEDRNGYGFLGYAFIFASKSTNQPEYIPILDSSDMHGFFPEIEEVGFALDSLPGGQVNFSSFCCNPSSISLSTPGIDRSRLQTANGAFKPGIRLDLEKSIFRPTLRWAHETPSPAPHVVGTLGASRRFCAVLRGSRHRRGGVLFRFYGRSVSGWTWLKMWSK